MAPTPRPMTRSSTSSPTSILSSASSRASNRPGHVALDDEQSSSLSPDLSADSRSSRVTRAAAGRTWRCARAPRAFGDLPGHPVVADHQEASPASGTAVRPSTIAGREGGASGDRSAVLVEQRHDPPNASPATMEVADVQRAPLDQHRGHRAAAAVEVGLDGHAWPCCSGFGPQVQFRVRVSGRRPRAVPRCRGLPARRRPRTRSWRRTPQRPGVLGELGTHPLLVRPLLVDLVDRHHDRYPRPPGRG